MTISMYQASVPVFTRVLGSLAGLLDKAEVYSATRKIDPAVLLQARLYPDMFPLARQVMLACDFAKGAGARLAGRDVPSFPDTETTIPELKARIEKTVAFLRSIPAAEIDGSEDRDISLKVAGNAVEFKGQPYLLEFALPNIIFHATTAYAILRHNGVEVGKRDFLSMPRP